MLEFLKGLNSIIIAVGHLGTLTQTTNITSLGFHGFNLSSVSSGV